jgi:hypothetical protein
MPVIVVVHTCAEDLSDLEAADVVLIAAVAATRSHPSSALAPPARPGALVTRAPTRPGALVVVAELAAVIGVAVAAVSSLAAVVVAVAGVLAVVADLTLGRGGDAGRQSRRWGRYVPAVASG